MNKLLPYNIFYFLVFCCQNGLALPNNSYTKSSSKNNNNTNRRLSVSSAFQLEAHQISSRRSWMKNTLQIIGSCAIGTTEQPVLAGAVESTVLYTFRVS
jgi:hypothetical protein